MHRMRWRISLSRDIWMDFSHWCLWHFCWSFTVMWI